MHAKKAALALLLVAFGASDGQSQVVPCGVFGLLANSDFGSNLSFWDADAEADWSAESSPRSPGSGSVEISVSDPASAAIRQCVQVKGGELYSLDVDIRIESQGQVEGKAGVVVRWHADTTCTDEIDDFPDSIYLMNAAEWTTRSLEPTSPLAARSASFELRATKIGGPSGSTFTANLDNPFFAFLGTPDCGDPICSYTGPSSSDAQHILSASVGRFSCRACHCDIDGSGVVSAWDALATLRSSVDLPVTLACPACVAASLSLAED